MATGVVDAVTKRELNHIVCEGIRNQLIWVNVAYNIYKDNPDNFQTITNALISFRQKGFDPYAETKVVKPDHSQKETIQQLESQRLRDIHASQDIPHVHSESRSPRK